MTGLLPLLPPLLPPLRRGGLLRGGVGLGTLLTPIAVGILTGGLPPPLLTPLGVLGGPGDQLLLGGGGGGGGGVKVVPVNTVVVVEPTVFVTVVVPVNTSRGTSSLSARTSTLAFLTETMVSCTVSKVPDAV